MSSVIFKGNKVASLKDTIQVGKDDSTAPRIINSTADPTSTATDANVSSLLLNRTTGEFFNKVDSGSNTNWLRFRNTGPVNYVKNPNADVDTSNTSNTANVTIARQTTGNLRGIGSFDITFNSAAVAGNYAEFDLYTVDSQDLGQPVSISFDYSGDASLVSGDIEVVVRDITGAVDIPVNATSSSAGEVLATGALTTRRRFTGTVNLDDTNTSYSIRLQVKSSPAATAVMRVSNIELGPQKLVPGSIVTEWEIFSPTGSWTTNTSYTGKKRRVGDSMEIFVTVNIDNGAPDTATLEIDVPDGLLLDLNKLHESAGNIESKLGECYIHDAGTSANRTGGSVYAGGAGILRCIAEGSTVVDQANPFTFATNDYVLIHATLPIDGWSAGAVLTNNEAVFSTVKASAAGDPASATSGNPIIFPTERWDDTNSYDNTTGRFTAPISGMCRVHGAIESANTGVLLHVYKNAASDTLAGATDSNGEGVFSATVEVAQGDLIDLRPNNTLDAISGSVINFEMLPDFSTFSVQGPYEVLASTAATVTPSANGVVDSATDGLANNFVTCSPGKWRLEGRCSFSSVGGTAGITNVESYLADAVDTFSISTGLIAGYQRATVRLSTGEIENIEQRQNAIVEITSTTSFYVTPIITAVTIGNARVDVTIYAERIS